MRLASAVIGLALFAAACEREPARRASRPPPYYAPPGQPPPGYGPGGPPYAAPGPGWGGPGYGAPPPGAPPPGPGPVPSGPTPAPPPGPGFPPPVAADPINATDLVFLRGRAQAILPELVAALSPGYEQRVRGIPLVVDDTAGEVNAFAACIKGRALMAITDGLLEIEAHLAQTQATDEIFRTSKTDEYIALLARHQRPGAPVVRPAPGFLSPEHQNDPRKVRRQHEIFDEQVAFVLGHELAHHYLGHLPCTAPAAPGPVDPGELGRALSGALPLFNQSNELGADVGGTQNVLTAGSRRAGHRWTEGGGLLTMRFFAGMDRSSPVDVLFSFERTHPPPAVRVPVIQQTANGWRLTGGMVLPIPGFGG